MTTRTALRRFSAELNDLGDKKEVTDGFAAVVRSGDTHQVAIDETTFVERLSRQVASDGQTMVIAAHRHFDIGEISNSRSPRGRREGVGGRSTFGSQLPQRVVVAHWKASLARKKSAG